MVKHSLDASYFVGKEGVRQYAHLICFMSRALPLVDMCIDVSFLPSPSGKSRQQQKCNEKSFENASLHIYNRGYKLVAGFQYLQNNVPPFEATDC